MSRSIAVLALLICLAQIAAAGQPKPNVLVLYAYPRLMTATIEVDRGLNAAMESVADIHTEFLDNTGFRGESHDQTVRNYLRDKYAGHPINVVVAGGLEALLFLLHQRGQIFPNVPVVYMGVSSSELRSLDLPADIVGVADAWDFAVTVAQALRLHPKAKRLVLVTGASKWDRAWESRLHDEAPILQNRVQLEFLAGLPTDELLKRLVNLGDEAVVYTPGYFGDGNGQLFTPLVSVGKMAEVSTAPVYSPFITFMGSGVVGGQMFSFEATGRQAGEIVKQLLHGEPIFSPKLRQVMSSQFHVDWRQVKRWSINEADIPPGTVVHFRELSLWGMHRTEMIILLIMVPAQAFLIAWLLFERRKRNRVKDALQESEAFLSLAATASNTCLWHWESGSGQIWATDKAQEMFGVSPEGGMDSVSVLAIVHPDDRERLRETVKEALKLGADTGAEYRIVLPGGSVRWIMSRGKVLTVSRSEQVRLVGISIDITDRKAVELQAAQDRAQLEHMDRVTMLGALSASLSHELNQPLTAILTNAQVGQRLSAGLQEEFVELAEIFDDIASEARRAGEYIHSLRGLFKQGKPHIQQFNINDLINKVLGLIASELLMRHISLVRDFASQLPTVSADPVQIEQVLLNLVMNAAQAMEASSLEKRELTIRTEASNAGIRVSVIDSGEGMSAGQLDTLFEPFVSTKPDGLGVGLMICHSIIRSHRGQLTATNNAEHGATFCFTLPLGTA